LAINVSHGGTSGRRSRGAPPLSEINVTPFVDVALVLLIIFMITAHVMEYGIDIDVPKTRAVSTSAPESPVIVQITKSGEVYLGKDPVNINRLVEDIRSKYPGQTAVFLRASGQTPWEPIANVMSILGEAKFGVKAVTQADERSPGKR
jgi:biopolymer transport protein ExbD